MNAVPDIDGVFNCYLDPVSARQLFADQDFQRLFQGATSANQVFKQGMINDFLGLRFVPTTEAFVQAHPTIPGAVIRRPIICGQGALIEGDFAGMASDDVAPRTASSPWSTAFAWSRASRSTGCSRSLPSRGTGSAGFCAPSDTTTNPTVIPTATNAAFKRAVMVEHVG